MQSKEFMESIVGLSDNTRKAYGQTIVLFDKFIGGQEPTADNIRKFLLQYKPSSILRYKAAIKDYWEWKYPSLAWPFNRRSFPATRRAALRYIQPETVRLMIALAETEDERMFMKTLFQLGCRISEIRLIEQSSITDAGVVVRTKGGDVKLKILTQDFLAQLRIYAKDKEDKLFPKSYGYYNLLIKRLGSKAGRPDACLHMIRHARAVDLLRKGMSLTDLQQFLGHVNLSTTAIYLQVTKQELTEVLERLEAKASPLPQI
jgi:integrase/recombinase XerD